MDIEKSKSTQEEPKKETDGWYHTRYTQILLLFANILIAYGMRVNLSVGIVAMTDPDASSNPDIPTYDWDETSIILSSFFWGYIIPQVGAGHLSKKYGGKWILIIAMLMCSLFGILIPIAADLYGSGGVMFCRALQGFSQGFFFPTIHTLLSKWTPLSERSRLGSFVYAGGPCGTVISMPITGWISASSAGWPAAFYLYGAFGLLWAIAFLVLGSNSPSEHKTISEKERDYIMASQESGGNVVNEATPWRAIATSLPVWAVLVAHCGQNWGFWTLLTEIPSYMKHVMGFDIKSNGLLSAAPYLTLWILSFVFSGLSDYFMNRNLLTIGACRKIFNSIGLYIPAAALIFLGFVSADQEVLAILLLIIAVGINSATYCAYNINHIDLSPNHAGTLMGITNCVSNIFSIIAPMIVQFVVTDEEDPSQWRIVFFTASAIYVLTNTFFVVFGSGEVQSWNSQQSNNNKSKDST